MSVHEESNLTVATDRPRTFTWLGLGWLLVAACLGLMAWTLLQIDSSGVYILLAPGINSITGWVTGIYVSLVFSYLAFAMFLLTPGTSYLLQSPNDGRSALIVNRTFLHAGGVTVYEPRSWPIYVEVGSVGYQ